MTIEAGGGGQMLHVVFLPKTETLIVVAGTVIRRKSNRKKIVTISARELPKICPRKADPGINTSALLRHTSKVAQEQEADFAMVLATLETIARGDGTHPIDLLRALRNLLGAAPVGAVPPSISSRWQWELAATDMMLIGTCRRQILVMAIPPAPAGQCTEWAPSRHRDMRAVSMRPLCLPGLLPHTHL